MSWLRVDDSFADHPKVIALEEHLSPLMAMAAVGLWTSVGCWCSKHERSDFSLPALLRIAPSLDKRTVKKLASALVKVRLWTSPGEGYSVHDFDAYRAQVKRGSSAGRAQVAHGSGVDPACHAQESTESQPENTPSPDPTRPVPSRPEEEAAEVPARLPTSSPAVASSAERQRRDLRCEILRGWLEGYGNSIGLMPSPSAVGVREHLDVLIGKGATEATALAAAKALSDERWWVGNGKYDPPGLKHFAENFEKYHARITQGASKSTEYERLKARNRELREKVNRAQCAGNVDDVIRLKAEIKQVIQEQRRAKTGEAA